MYQTYKKSSKRASINFGTIEGGIKPEVVADSCKLKIDIRWTVENTQEMIINEIKKILSVIGKNQGVKYKIQSLLPSDSYFGPFIIDENHKMIKKIEKILNLVEVSPVTSSLKVWTDASTMMNAGVSTIVFGPGNIKLAHTENEYLEIDQLVKSVECYLAFSKYICEW